MPLPPDAKYCNAASKAIESPDLKKFKKSLFEKNSRHLHQLIHEARIQNKSLVLLMKPNDLSQRLIEKLKYERTKKEKENRNRMRS